MPEPATQHVVQAAPPIAAPAVVEPARAADGPAPQTTPPLTNPEPGPIAAAAPAAETPKPEPAKLSVGLSATERTWVSVSSDGKTVFRGVLRASQTKNIEGLDNAKLLTGNAAGLDVRWNGKPIGPLGLHGQVRVVVFTPENFQILSPRKM